MLISQNLVFHFENHTYMYVSTMPFAIYIKKYLKAKEEEELWKLKYFISSCANILISKKIL